MDAATISYEHIYNITNIDAHVNSSYQTGFMPDLRQRTAFMNSNLQRKSMNYEQDTQYLQTRITEILEENRYQKLLIIFKQRFEADRDIFANIEEQKVIDTFEQMAELLLHLSPLKITADITEDASIMVQAYFKNFRFYWETYLSDEEPEPYSALNIFAEKELKFTASDYFQEIFNKVNTLALFKQKHQIIL